MQVSNQKSENSKKKNELLLQFGIIPADTFNLLKRTLKFDDEYIKH